MTNDFTEFYDCFLNAAVAAGKIARECRKNGLKIMSKADGTPVSDADLFAHDRIIEILQSVHPQERIVSEEDADHAVAPGSSFFLIDPIDGTKAYVNGENDYCVNIAYIQQGRPAAGLIYIPETETAFFAAKGAGAFKQRTGRAPEKISLQTRKINENATLHCVLGRGSRLPPTSVIFGGEDHKMTQTVIASAVKFCLIAEGAADLYYRRGATGEWDTAAGEIILSEAGGALARLNGEPLLYGKPHYLNDGFIACGDEAFLQSGPLLKNAVKNI